MTPHKASTGRGTFMVDKTIRGIGRIQRASGTTNARTLRAILAMIDQLADRGMVAQLVAIRDGKIRPVIAYGLFRTGQLQDLPDSDSLDKLRPVWDAWVAKTKAKQTRMARKYAMTRLETVLPKSPQPADLPAAVRALLDTLEDQPAAFNRTRAAVMAFLRDRFGKKHALYGKVVDVPSLTEVKHKRPAPTIGKAIEARDGMPERAAAAWWSMYTTGMGRDEYDGLWEVGVDSIAVHGGKRPARDRIIPRIAMPTRRRLGWPQLAAALAPFGLQPYDARRGFAHLMEEAKITRTRRKMYLGHAAGDVTGGYETADLAAYVAEDGAALRAKIADEEQRLAERRRALVRAG